MSSLLAGTDSLICARLGIEERRHLGHLTGRIEPLSDSAALDLVEALYSRIAANLADEASSPSNPLWACRRVTSIGDGNPSRETMLERAVANLAENGHMPGWFNQCPVASGLTDSGKDRRRAIDLLHISGTTARLIELKWGRVASTRALFQLLEYGLIYMLARQRKHALGLEVRRLMQESVNEIRLEVVGPHSFFAKGHRPDLFGQVDKALRSFAARHTNGAWSMSLSALAFPERFDTVPFASGKAVKGKCAGAILTREARQVCDAFSELAEARTAPGQIAATDRFLPGVPGRDIERILDDAPGDEIGSGKFDRPTSSAALAVNTFGFFLHRAADLPTLPALDHAGWPARLVSLERTIRFKWTGGRHPVPDCLITTRTALIGIECKRFEPFRAPDAKGFSDAFWRPVWGARMNGYQLVRDLLHADRRLYSHLDAVQLVKHALALREEVRRQKAHRGLQPILLYVYAEPEIWPGTHSPVDPAEKARHRDEIASFARHVANDEVAFSACSYREVLDTWRAQADESIRAHAQAVVRRFSP